MMLTLIAEYLGAAAPVFMWASKRTFALYVGQALEQFDTHILAFQSELQGLYKVHEGRFKISPELRADFKDALAENSAELMNCCSGYDLKPKDIVVLKLYFAFMGRRFSDKHNNLFMRQTYRFLFENKGHLLKALDPDTEFRFSEEVLDSVKELIAVFKEEGFRNSDVSELPLFDRFTSVLIEAMQYANLIPNPNVGELEAALERCEEEREKFVALKNLVFP